MPTARPESERPYCVVAFLYAFSGGAGRSVSSLLDGLRRLGQRVHLIARAEKIQYSGQFEPLHLIKPGTPGSERRQLRGILADIQHRDGVDLFLTNTRRDLLIARPLRHPAHVHVVRVSFATKLSKKGALGRVRFVLRIRRALRDLPIVTISCGLLEEVRGITRDAPRFVETIYNPFDLESIRDLGSRSDPEVPGIPYLVSVGHLVRRKRHDLVIRAFADLPESYRLAIVGDGPLRDDLTRLAANLGVADRVDFVGFQENPYPWIRSAAVLVLASDYEGFGRVLVEALALGTRVVSTRCLYGPDEILTGELGQFLVPTDDPAALGEAIRRALDSYPPNLAESAQRFDVEASARAYLSLIPRIATGPAEKPATR